jgi:hypothetical protein
VRCLSLGLVTDLTMQNANTVVTRSQVLLELGDGRVLADEPLADREGPPEYDADGGHASTASPWRWRSISRAKPLAVAYRSMILGTGLPSCIAMRTFDGFTSRWMIPWDRSGPTRSIGRSLPPQRREEREGTGR